jgi:hypothetical protein
VEATHIHLLCAGGALAGTINVMAGGMLDSPRSVRSALHRLVRILFIGWSAILTIFKFQRYA